MADLDAIRVVLRRVEKGYLVSGSLLKTATDQLNIMEEKFTSDNSDYTKCADEVLNIINFSRDSSHGRKIIECIKRHFA